MPEECDAALLVALVGAPNAYEENNCLLKLGTSGRAIEIVVQQKMEYVNWNSLSGQKAPSDWQQLNELSGVLCLGLSEWQCLGWFAHLCDMCSVLLHVVANRC